MTDATFIGATDAAGMLGLTYRSFLSRREDLERDHGFPPPISWRGRPLSWRRGEVQAWLDADAQARGAKVDAPDIPPELLASGRVAMLREARR